MDHKINCEQSETVSEKEDGVIDMTKYEIMNEPQQHILKIQDDSSCFRRELASMTIAN
jgi:hypothetical protein